MLRSGTIRGKCRHLGKDVIVVHCRVHCRQMVILIFDFFREMLIYSVRSRSHCVRRRQAFFLAGRLDFVERPACEATARPPHFIFECHFQQHDGQVRRFQEEDRRRWRYQEEGTGRWEEGQDQWIQRCRRCQEEEGAQEGKSSTYIRGPNAKMLARNLPRSGGCAAFDVIGRVEWGNDMGKGSSLYFLPKFTYGNMNALFCLSR